MQTCSDRRNRKDECRKSWVATTGPEIGSGGNPVAPKHVTLDYNAAGQLSQIRRYASTGTSSLVATSTFSRDLVGRLTSLAHKKADNSNIATYAQTFDRAGRVAGIGSTLGTQPQQTVAYGYDRASQLTTADFSAQADESFTFDASGNRTNSGYATGANNRLLSDGTFDYTYDQEGNRLTRTRKSGQPDADDFHLKYEWDHRQRLGISKVTTNDAKNAKKRKCYRPKNRLP